MTGPSSARPADPQDLGLLVELVRACRAELSGQRGGRMWEVTGARTEPVGDQLLEEIERSDTLVVVGEYTGVGVGFAIARIAIANDDRPYVRVTDLFTLPEGRHVGVGESMMDACIEWARHHGAFAIDASVLPGTRDAKNFFEGFGLTARALTVSLDL